MGAISFGAIIVSLLIASEATFLSPQFGERLFQSKHGISNNGYKTKNVRETIYTQWIDHSNFEAGTFNQRIFVNDEDYEEGGPIFIFTSAYGGAEEYWLENSYISQIAEEQNGAIYAIEPRFYGNSRPTDDLSYANLQLLTYDQLIADLTDFVRYLRINLAQFGSNRFILFAYDTGATIGTFAHQQHPDLFDGVWAIGAPFDILFNFNSFFDDVFSEATNLLDSECLSIVVNSDAELNSLILGGNAARITELFGFENSINLNDAREVSLLFYVVSVLVGNNFEWGSVAEREDFCQTIVGSVAGGASDLEAFVGYVQPITSQIDLNWNNAVNQFRQTSWDAESSLFGERQAWFTTCTEWSWFTTSDGIPPTLPTARASFSEYFFTQFCYDVFGMTHDQVVFGNEQTSAALQLDASLQNVFFTYGGTDPFRLVGVTSDLNAASPARVIPGFGKVFELMRSDPDYVNEEFVETRAAVRSQILQWIGA